MANPLNLSEAELTDLRGLQAGTHLVGARDPVWDPLEALGLVCLYELRTGAGGQAASVRRLTVAGRHYETG